MFSEKWYWMMTTHSHCSTHFSYSLYICFCVYMRISTENKTAKHSTAYFLIDSAHTQLCIPPPFPSAVPSFSLSFWHPSLSAAMDCETNFYHYTLQVKKGSWECVIYAGFDFYVASTGSSIIALRGTLVHWAPDEMLSWHRYQSPYACPSPVPDVQEGACIVAAGLPPSASPLPPWRWRQHPPSFVIWMVRL